MVMLTVYVGFSVDIHFIFRSRSATMIMCSVFFSEKMKGARESIFSLFEVFFGAPTSAQIFSGTRTFTRAQNDFFSRVEVRISRA